MKARVLSTLSLGCTLCRPSLGESAPPPVGETLHQAVTAYLLPTVGKSRAWGMALNSQCARLQSWLWLWQGFCGTLKAAGARAGVVLLAVRAVLFSCRGGPPGC